MNDDQITMSLSHNDFTAIQEIALAERRKPSDVIRNLLEDVVDGKIFIEVPQAQKEKKHPTAVRVNTKFKARVEDMKIKTGLSVDKVLHLALKASRAG